MRREVVTKSEKEKHQMASVLCTDLELTVVELSKSVLLDAELQRFKIVLIILGLFASAIEIRQMRAKQLQQKRDSNQFKVTFTNIGGLED